MFEKITKEVTLQNDVVVMNNNYDYKIGNIEAVAICYTGFNSPDTIEEAKANAEFITYCFNLQQKYDISKLEEAIEIIESSAELLNLFASKIGVCTEDAALRSDAEDFGSLRVIRCEKSLLKQIRK